jgi:hypothetical protein
LRTKVQKNWRIKVQNIFLKELMIKVDKFIQTENISNSYQQ